MPNALVARGMAKMFDAYRSHVRLLDDGAGMGSLTAAFIEAAATASTPPHSIDVTAYEIDPILAAVLEATMEDRPAYNCAILDPPYNQRGGEVNDVGYQNPSSTLPLSPRVQDGAPTTCAWPRG